MLNAHLERAALVFGGEGLGERHHAVCFRCTCASTTSPEPGFVRDRADLRRVNCGSCLCKGNQGVLKGGTFFIDTLGSQGLVEGELGDLQLQIARPL